MNNLYILVPYFFEHPVYSHFLLDGFNVLSVDRVVITPQTRTVQVFLLGNRRQLENTSIKISNNCTTRVQNTSTQHIKQATHYDSRVSIFEVFLNWHFD